MDQRAFISSVMGTLKDERTAVANVVSELGAEPIWFEDFGGRDGDAEDAYLSEVASSSIYLGILGHDYGTILPSRLSATHAEYRHAERSGLRICVWTDARADWLADQQAFVDEVRTFHVTSSFESPEQLAMSVMKRLKRLAAEELSPWCKIAHVVFRATRIVEDGKRILITAMINDPDVAHALEGLRPKWWSAEGRWLTYAGRSRVVEVRNVTTVVESSRRMRVDLEATGSALQDEDRPTYVTLSSKSFSADDLIEINVRKALFGEPGPSGVQIIGGAFHDPFVLLRDLRPAEDVLRPLAELLLTEALVGKGQASRVTRFRASQPIEGGRRVELEWLPKALGECRVVTGRIAW